MATRREAAQALGVTDQALSHWWKNSAWFPKNAVKTDGRGRAVDWDIEMIRAAHPSRSGKESNGDELSQNYKRLRIATAAEKLKQEQIKTRAMQLNENVEQGNILTRDEMTQFVVEVIGVARDQFKTLPRQLARLIGDQETQRRLIDEGNRLVRGVLDRLADALEKGPGE